MPFDDSRRLTGRNLYFDASGAALETIGVDVDDCLIEAWMSRVTQMRDALGWPHGSIVARPHASGASLAFSAPPDQLYAATEVNEWALLSALSSFSPWEKLFAPGHAAVHDDESARQTLLALARAERRDDVTAILAEAGAHGVSSLLDDEALSIGSGSGSRVFALDALPDVAAIEWSGVRDVPVALVTGSNGKTTTTRLLAAMLRAHGWRTAYTSTDGVVVGDRVIEGGDYSGPTGARVALRERDVDAAVLETARGGMLRRGLAVAHVDVAVVTNVSADHFGEYGIHTLDDLVEVKLVVARALGADGVLVINADDALLARHAVTLGKRIAWFAFDADDTRLSDARMQGSATCGERDGQLVLSVDGVDHDLGATVTMPLGFEGAARYNIANIAAASLAASALGIAPSIIRDVITTFGRSRADNPGRLQHWSVGGVDVFVDYAHNPDGLRGLLEVATRRRGTGRLGILLGQAGNREDADVRELAAVAASFTPELIVLKDIAGFLRGREDGEIAAILRDELVRRGVGDERIVECLDEYEAAGQLLAWADAGDVLVLPIHGEETKLKLGARLATLADSATSSASR